MALVSVLGTDATVGIGAAGATDITDWVDSIDLGQSVNANDVTTLGHDNVVEAPGLTSFDISLSGFWDATIDTTMRAEIGVISHVLKVLPTGTATPTWTYTGWLGDFNVSVGGPGDPITWDATYHVQSFAAT